MTTIAKPRMDVDVIELPATEIVCAVSDCGLAATEMFHHSLCGGANPHCGAHADEGREFLRLQFASDSRVHHKDCDDLITPTNHSFRPI